MSKPPREFLKMIAREIPIYGAVVAAYVLLVLRFLGKPLDAMFGAHRSLYAVVALSLVIGQAFLLELTTWTLERMVARRRPR